MDTNKGRQAKLSRCYTCQFLLNPVHSSCYKSDVMNTLILKAISFTFILHKCEVWDSATEKKSSEKIYVKILGP